MSEFSPRRPSASLIVALLALFISLGGSVYAASKIDGAQIKKNSVPGNRLIADSVAGRQVRESSLRMVPRAQRAQNASTLAGHGPGSFVSAADVKRIRFDVVVASLQDVTQPVLEMGPLRLTATCSFNNASIEIKASTTAQNAGFDVGYERDNDLGSGTNGGSLGATPTTVLISTGNNTSHRYVGNLIYNDPSTTIAIPFAVFYSDAGSLEPNTRCFFTGTATRATG